ncbi:3-dehydroquinate synthase II family protein [Desulfonatronum sp. SC1]|uniref:3-dehydroquinate synthase II family protein n=1 Tax=Desulfonatronum sp. SC1 TaxID=2109626 RepID=UPI000D31013E|nr:3-dehydroquinate synthase II family protein [Desulfonatronum sp. SC1]PTN37710.1 3-dehydroquinate synthase II family protein [Desulfonatronum sp. SC1]
MIQVWFKAVPFDKTAVTLALESGVDALIAPADKVDEVKALGRVVVFAEDEVDAIRLESKADEEAATRCLRSQGKVLLRLGWEIIPVENILAQGEGLGVEVASLDQARLAAGILERGVDFVVVVPEAIHDLKAIVAALKLSEGRLELSTARIDAITPVGLGHRVCVDTCSLLRTGQGMLVGNSSAFTFLVHAETEENAYVAARPFRINAGAVHAYTLLPRNRTAYLGEVASGREVLIVDAEGRTSLAVVGRSKVEIRPLILISATCGDKAGTIFLQNAETIRLVRPDGTPVSVVALVPGDEVLCRLDTAGRHFGMAISEEISEA